MKHVDYIIGIICMLILWAIAAYCWYCQTAGIYDDLEKLSNAVLIAAIVGSIEFFVRIAFDIYD